jgi:hypothetical protein
MDVFELELELAVGCFAAKDSGPPCGLITKIRDAVESVQNMVGMYISRYATVSFSALLYQHHITH